MPFKETEMCSAQAYLEMLLSPSWIIRYRERETSFGMTLGIFSWWKTTSIPSLFEKPAH
jgi:hypothetical protein